MENLNSNSFDYEVDKETLQNIKFEVVEEELLGIQHPTVQVYEQS